MIDSMLQKARVRHSSKEQNRQDR